MASEFFGRQRECRFYTAGCGNKMAVSVTGPLAVKELGGPVIPGIHYHWPIKHMKNRISSKGAVVCSKLKKKSFILII